MIEPADDCDRIAAEEFWMDAAGEEAALSRESAFVVGFAEGALQIYAEIQDGLD